MEDEHIRIDDLASHLGSLLACPSPSAFYGVFDGHGGADAAAYMKSHATRFLFQDAHFPQWSEAAHSYMDSVESSIRCAFLQADQALSHEPSVSRSSGTTALAALVLGRYGHSTFFHSACCLWSIFYLLALLSGVDY